jgi:hypothetical protein
MLVNIFSIIAILSHEAYGFWALPSLLIILCHRGSDCRELNRNRLFKGVLAILPAIAAFFLCLIFKGSALEASLIHSSWQGLDGFIPGHGVLSSPIPRGAIAAIGWTTKQGLGLSLATLNDVTYILWIPAVWMLTIYASINLFIGKSNDHLSDQRRAVVLFQFLMVSPLFLLGVDYGRWIFLWLSSSALLYGLLSSACNGTFKNLPLLSSVTGVSLQQLAPGVELKGRSRLILLFLGIPYGAWSLKGFLLSTPIGYFLSISRQLIKNLS